MKTNGLDKKYKKANGQINNKKIRIEWTKAVLIFQDLNKKYLLITDACDYAYDAVLSQFQGMDLLPIAYFSKSMTETLAYEPSEYLEMPIRWIKFNFFLFAFDCFDY